VEGRLNRGEGGGTDVMQLHGYEFFSDLVAEQYINTTYSVNAAHAPPLLFPPNHADRVVRYVVDIEARTQRLVRQWQNVSRVRFTEVSLEDIAGNTNQSGELLKLLDLVPTSALEAMSRRNSNKKKASNCSMCSSLPLTACR
jgi:hypothetical protein